MDASEVTSWLAPTALRQHCCRTNITARQGHSVCCLGIMVRPSFRSLNATDDSGRTALHHAARQGLAEVAFAHGPRLKWGLAGIVNLLGHPKPVLHCFFIRHFDVQSPIDPDSMRGLPRCCACVQNKPRFGAGRFPAQLKIVLCKLLYIWCCAYMHIWCCAYYLNHINMHRWCTRPG